jgi:hypothetical protein
VFYSSLFYFFKKKKAKEKKNSPQQKVILTLDGVSKHLQDGRPLFENINLNFING